MKNSNTLMPRPAGEENAFWIALFTPKTWKQFQTGGARVVGFPASAQRRTNQVRANDKFLCYVTGEKRFVGLLNATGHARGPHAAWADDEYPLRFQVEPLINLPVERGIDIDSLYGAVGFYKSERDRGRYKGRLRRSPQQLREHDDAQEIVRRLENAARHRSKSG